MTEVRTSSLCERPCAGIEDTLEASIGTGGPQSVFDAAMAPTQESGLRENCTSRLSERAEGGRKPHLPRLYSWEAGEQSGTARSRAICSEAECSGAGGAKGGGQGECRPAKHAPDAESGKRVTGAGTHTESGEGKEEGEVHRALPSYQHRPARTVVLRTQGGRCTRRGSADVEGLRGRPRAQARGLARPGPTGSVSGVAEPASVHIQAGRTTAPARGRHDHIELHFGPVGLWVRLRSPIPFIRFAVSGLWF